MNCTCDFYHNGARFMCRYQVIPQGFVALIRNPRSGSVQRLFLAGADEFNGLLMLRGKMHLAEYVPHILWEAYTF